MKSLFTFQRSVRWLDLSNITFRSVERYTLNWLTGCRTGTGFLTHCRTCSADADFGSVSVGDLFPSPLQHSGCSCASKKQAAALNGNIVGS